MVNLVVSAILLLTSPVIQHALWLGSGFMQNRYYEAYVVKAISSSFM